MPDWHPWEDYRKGYAARKEMGGGVVLTLSHPLDYLRWLFGEVRELYAMVGKVSDLDLDVEDQAEVIFSFENHVVGSLHLDYYRQPKRHDLEIGGTQGILYWDYANNQVCLKNGAGAEKIFPAPEGYERNQMYLDEMRHFINVVKGKEEPCCKYDDGKKALQLAWGILQSGRYKQRVIFNCSFKDLVQRMRR